MRLGRQHIRHNLQRLPIRGSRFAIIRRHMLRPTPLFHGVDVPRAINPGALDGHFHGKPNVFPTAQHSGIANQLSDPMNSHAMGGHSVDEQESHLTVIGNIAHGQPHPVAIKTGKAQRLRIVNLHKTAIAPLVGNGREAVGAQGRKEEVILLPNKGLSLSIELGTNDQRFEAVGQRRRFKLTLQSAVAWLVKLRYNTLSLCFEKTPAL